MSKLKVNIGQEADVQIIWNVLSVDRTEEMEKNIRDKFAQKYGIPPSHVKVIPNYITKNGSGEIALNSDVAENIQDPKFQQQLFPVYLQEHGIEDYDLDELIKIDSQINSLIDYNSYEKGRKYTLKWVDWSNFLSYGPNNHFDFTDLNGLVLLNSIPANQGGKSTFAYDILHFLFFGKTSSGKADVLPKLFNNHLPEETTLFVKGCISIDGINYIIERTLTRPASTRKVRTVTQKVEYFRLLPNGDTITLDDNDNLNEGGNVKTSQAIKEAIGNERDFDLVISANAENLKNLISLKETDRGRLLSRWIGLLPLEDKDIKAREKWNHEINVNRYSNSYNTETLNQEIDVCNSEIEKCKENIEKNSKIITESEKKIKDFNNTKETLLSSKKEINANLLKVDVVTLQKSIDDITQSGKIKATEKATQEAKVKEFGDIDFSDIDYKNKIKEKESLIIEINNIKYEINTLKRTNEDLKKGEYCPTCGHKLEGVDNQGKIKNNEEKIKALTNSGIELNTKKVKLEEDIASMDSKRNQYLEKNKIELLISKLDVDIANLRIAFKEKKQILKEIEENKNAIEDNNRIDNSLNIVNENIKVEERIKETARITITEDNKDIEQYKKDIIDRQVIIKKIEEEKRTEKNWKTYLMLVGKDGISKMVLRNALPIINSELKRFLDGVCDFDVEVEINEKNDVEFTMICSDGVRQSLSAGSGFEQTAAALALRVVLANMSALSKPPFLLLDEILGGVAEENYDNMKKLYDKICKYYAFVMQITHLKAIEDWHDKTVTVVKTNHISHIEVKQ